MKKWISAFRLRTLPLAFSCIIVGAGLAMEDGYFNLTVTLLAFATTLFLQLLSNLANDYGDFVKGTDNKDRVGPERALQSGEITKSQMKIAMIIVASLSAIFGCLLIYVGTESLLSVLALALLGLFAIGAAVKYTVGEKAYGYAGFGDLFVLLFFGWIGVLGSYFLNAHTMRWELLLPATSFGLFSVAVLNINNMRDHVEDEKVGKITLAVRLGIKKAKRYHFMLNLFGIQMMVIFVIPDPTAFWFLLLGIILFIKPAKKILKSDDFESFDPFLKKQAINTFLYAMLTMLVLYVSD
jgi:1,4-dihydroxy-2-naphthoate polyprenyltransferase